MRRLIALVVLIAALMPTVWLRSPYIPPERVLTIRYVPLLPARRSEQAGDISRQLGPFRLENAWRMESRYRRFGGYSALVALGGGELLAISDSGSAMHFTPPDAPAQITPSATQLLPGKNAKISRDIEAATADLATDRIWLSFEFENMVMRFDWRDGELLAGESAKPAGMKDWGSNSGPESFARLADGSFLALREGFTGWFERRRHSALRFAADPVDEAQAEAFTFVGPQGFSPTDMAQLPDGRMLILLRRVIWPIPAKFGGALAIGDPAAIRKGEEWHVRTLASWGTELPADNFEGLAIEPDSSGGAMTVWLISDDNRAELQSTVLWKLRLNLADLPAQRKKARGKPARPKLVTIKTTDRQRAPASQQ